ncbi:hypothetical protein MGI18_13845 [Bacillus sp. OVS6]|nr:hypothetical protein MGI18_13845 [Bacillus sp. OVS6]
MANGDIGFNFKDRIFGQSDKSLIKENVLREIEQWILDLLLDKFLYENHQRQVRILEDNNILRIGTEIISTSGKNTVLNNLLNELLTTIYQVKYENIEYARLGVSSKENRMISVIIKEKDSEDEIIAP